MTPQELAHWRYRQGAIEREQEQLRKSLDGLRRAQSNVRFARLQEADRKNKGVRLTPDEVREIEANSTRFDGDIESLEGVFKTNQYLLEEARYMIELGEVMQHGQAQSDVAAQEQSQQA